MFTMSLNDMLDKVFLLKKQMPVLMKKSLYLKFVLSTWNFFFLRYMNNNINPWVLNIFQVGCKEITAYFNVSIFILFILLMKKIKANWVFFTLKTASAVNLLSLPNQST